MPTMKSELLAISYIHPILDYIYIYYSEILFVALLGIITLFRREMSCNSVLREDIKVETKPRSPSMEKKFQSESLWNKTKSTSCPLSKLPDEVQIKCMEFLHPKDILQFSCSDRQMHEMVHNDVDAKSVSSLLWYHLFLRDYAKIVTEWKYGVEAVRRSRSMALNCPPMIASLLKKKIPSGIITDVNTHAVTVASETSTSRSRPTMKDFYFKFTQTWMEYCIAGRIENPTLVGIHGHVFDMSSFIEDHPGSPETIIMQGGGKNTTNFFEAVGHSSGARNLALNRLIEVVDLSCCRGDNDQNGAMSCGVTKRHEGIDGILPMKRSKARFPGTLSELRQRLDKEKRVMKEEARRSISLEMAKRGQANIIGDINVYFDPLCYCWKGWYINLDCQPVFIQKISFTS